jgi:hypothetical protein
MNANTPGTEISIVRAAGTSKPIYLAETPLLDVLVEQLEYLVAHENGCAPDCPDCRRLAQVKRCLLQPFWEKASAKAMAA